MSFRALKQLREIVEAGATETLEAGGLVRSTGELTFQDAVANGGAPVTLSNLIAAVGSFLDLSDTPGAYVANSLVVVNGAGTGLTFASATSNTFLALLDTPPSYAGWADHLLTVNAAQDALEYSDTTVDQVRSAEPDCGGVYEAGDGELVIEDGTHVRIKAGSCKFINRFPGGITYAWEASWPDIVHPIAGIANAQSWILLEDPGVTGTATVYELTTEPTAQQLRGRILLGLTIHDLGVLVSVMPTPDIWHDNIRLVRDNVRTGDPVRVVSGTIAERAGTLQFSTTDHKLFGEGINFHTIGGDDNPNVATFLGTAGAAQTFDIVQGDGTVLAGGQASLPKNYNLGGVLTPLTGTKTVVHQIVVTSNGEWWVQAGTTAWDDYPTAVQSINLELANNPLWPTLKRHGAQAYVAVVQATATQWAANLAKIIPIGGVGGATGGGVTTFVGLTDTPANYTGSGGKFVAVKAAADGLEFVTAPSGGTGDGILATFYGAITSNGTLTTTPVALAFTTINHTPNAAYLTWSSPTFTAVKKSRIRIKSIIGFSCKAGSVSAVCRAEVVKNATTNLATGDAGCYSTTVIDNQVEVSRTYDFLAGETFRIYGSTLGNQVDMWASGQTRVQVEVLKDLT